MHDFQNHLHSTSLKDPVIAKNIKKMNYPVIAKLSQNISTIINISQISTKLPIRTPLLVINQRTGFRSLPMRKDACGTSKVPWGELRLGFVVSIATSIGMVAFWLRQEQNVVSHAPHDGERILGPDDSPVVFFDATLARLMLSRQPATMTFMPTCPPGHCPPPQLEDISEQLGT